MTHREIYNDLKAENAFNIQLINTDTTTNGIIIDTKDYRKGLLFVIKTGVVTAGDITPLLEESDDSGFTTSNEVADINIVPVVVDGVLYETGQEAALKMDASNTVRRFGVVDTKRYLRLSFVSANSADLTASADILKEGETLPVDGLVK